MEEYNSESDSVKDKYILFFVLGVSVILFVLSYWIHDIDRLGSRVIWTWAYLLGMPFLFVGTGKARSLSLKNKNYKILSLILIVVSVLMALFGFIIL